MNRNDMENGNEKWLNRLKDSLKDYREPAPPSVGSRLEKELFAPSKKTVSFSSAWKYAAAAAAVLLIFFSVKGIFETEPEKIRVAAPGNNTPELVSENKNSASRSNRDVRKEAPEVTPGFSAGDNITDISDSREKASGLKTEKQTGKESGKVDIMPAEQGAKQQRRRQEEEKTEIITPRPEDMKAGEGKIPESSKRQMQILKQESTAHAAGVTGKLHKEKKRREKSKGKKEKILAAEYPSYPDGNYDRAASGWQMGLAVANSGVSSKSSSAGGSLKGSSVMNSSSDFAPVPEGTRVVFLNGAPYLSKIKQSYTYKHKQPVSFGLYIGREVARRLAVETGLNYTLLLSDVNTGAGSPLRQTLHFIGIPVRANWSFLQRNDLSLYLGAGGMLEKCVSGTLGHEKVSVRELQYSVFAAPGIQYNIGGRFNIYFEPGIAYYFDNKSDIKTIRSDSPLNFMLQLGFRFAY